MAEQYQIRQAATFEVPILLATAQAVQDKLTHAGSAQQIAGYSARNICERIECSELFVLEVSGSVIGSVFVEPVAPERFPQIAAWNAAPGGCPAWFLYGLVIHPEHQGWKWGQRLLRGVRCQKKLATRAVLLLDCWAGNVKLRHFYAEAGFVLHGVFPEEDYEIAVFRKAL